MSLTKQNGNSFPAFPRLFDDFFSRELFNWDNSNFSATRTTIPAANIIETADAFEVELAVPGMEKQDFKITLEGNQLKITSARQQQSEEKAGQYTRREFSYQSFQRTFELAKEVVDQSAIKATYNHGILKLLIPKKEEAKAQAPKLIDIA